MRKKVADLEAGDVLVGPLSGKPQWVVRSVELVERDETLGRRANVDKVPLADPKQLGLGDGPYYKPMELPLDMEVEVFTD